MYSHNYVTNLHNNTIIINVNYQIKTGKSHFRF